MAPETQTTEMQTCPVCQAQVPASATYCPHCRARMGSPTKPTNRDPAPTGSPEPKPPPVVAATPDTPASDPAPELPTDPPPVVRAPAPQPEPPTRPAPEIPVEPPPVVIAMPPPEMPAPAPTPPVEPPPVIVPPPQPGARLRLSVLGIHTERTWELLGALVVFFLLGRFLMDSAFGALYSGFALAVAGWAPTRRVLAAGLFAIAVLAVIAARGDHETAFYFLPFAVAASTAPRNEFTSWLGHVAVCGGAVLLGLVGLSRLGWAPMGVGIAVGLWTLVCVAISHLLTPNPNAGTPPAPAVH